MFKVQEMRELIRLIDKSTINEFTYKNDDAKLTIKKNCGITQVTEAPVANATPVTPSAPAVPSAPVQAAKQEPETAQVESTETVEEDANIEEVVSPMVGTFYQKPSPENDPYVSIGDQVTNETIVCIVEAMKLFNEIESEVNGEIVEILVNDGDLVEYGQPLFKVKKK